MTATRCLLAAAAVLLAAACAPAGSGDATAPSFHGAPVRPVTLPDLSRLTASVQDQIRDRETSLRATVDDPRAGTAERAVAYGEMGKLLLAAQLFEAAEVCLENAQALEPDDGRWSYYLGHLHRLTGAHASAAEHFAQTLDRRPDDPPSLVWLGMAYLELDRPAEAEEPFARALAIDPTLAAARAGLGRAALAQREYARAVEHLLAALAHAPEATSLRYPLGIAYRGAGDLETAAVHLEQRGDVEVRLADPLMQDLAGLLQSATAYESDGIRALELEEWEAAAAAFRRGIELDSDRASLRHRLGTALFMMGDAAAAVTEFEAAIRQAPDHAQAHYSLGVVAASAGRFDEAVAYFDAAVRHDPTYVEARLGLADLLQQLGRVEASLTHYVRVIELDPGLAEAWLGSAVALARLEQYVAARERLVDAARLHPGHPELTHALARLLAAAPDDRVRDGARALALLQPLLAAQRSVDLGETMAMILAERGDHAGAAELQRELVAAADQQGHLDLASRLRENLRRYERGQPPLSPWGDD